jgi:AraC-like DNA-binding protein
MTSTTLPLAFGHHHARVDHDPDTLAQVIGRAVPLRDLTPLEAHKPFAHRSFSVRAAELEITAAAHSPLHGANHAQAKAVFTLPLLGEKRFLINGRPYRARAGHNALLLPGEAYTLDTTVCSGVIFSVCPRALAKVAATMAGPERGLHFAPIDRPVELLESHPPQGNMLALLRRSLGLIDLICGTTSRLPARLGLDDKILRLLALLLYPELLSSEVSEAEPLEPREASAFADLIAAMQENPRADWTLTGMERQASLSRVRLTRHFQVTFGCGPLEWLRLQRLCWARQRLEANDGVSLAQLALDCGFGDLEAFRSAFADRFHFQPEWLS